MRSRPSSRAAAGDVAVVVGPDGDGVAAEALKAAPEAKIVVQREAAGTADAVLAARGRIERGYDDILVLYADTPLIEAETIAAHARALAQGADVVALGFEAADPAGYGRLIATRRAAWSRSARRRTRARRSAPRASATPA